MDLDQEKLLLEDNAKELFDNAPCGYVILRPDGIIAGVNETFLTLTGYQRNEILSGFRFRDLLTVPGRIYFETHFTPLVKMQGFVKEVAFDLLRPGRESLPILVNAVEKRSTDGNTAVTWVTAFDATDRRQYERELVSARMKAEQAVEIERAARELAEQVNRYKDEFLALISHELRTPLNAIVGWTLVLRRDAVGNPELDDGLSIIERNARVQVQLVEDLMDMGRITSGKIRLDVQTVNLASVIEDALATALPAANAKSIGLQKVLDSSVTVSGDPSRLQQVFWNLLSNAIKFTPRGGFVRMVMRRVNSHIEVCVIDSGKGMKAEFIAHAFEKFRQSDDPSVRKSSGLGIGLSIVRHLVEMHGGLVTATSQGEGLGSTFIVDLPLTVAHDESPIHPRAAVASISVAGTDISLSGVKVLVVDDEPDAREMIKRLLVRCGAKVETAASVEDALSKIETVEPNVLVSDVGMPGQDGYDLIRQVRMLGGAVGNVRAIALTAFGRLEDRTRSMLAGYQMHLAKPIEPSELIVTIATLSGVIGHRGE